VTRVLGIDPGLAILGWSVIDVQRGAVSLVAFGCVRTPAHTALTKRLCDVHLQLSALVDEHKPSQLALETLFFVKNAKNLAGVGHARGVILLVAGQRNVDVFEYAPRQIKLALTGSGAAEKFQMQSMVQRLLHLKEIPQPDDAADAVAVALCHAQYAQSLGKSTVTV
jgi:crossover junction endodeoxyribonuclease RuvC